MNESYSSNYFKSYNGLEKLYFQKFDFGKTKDTSKKQIIAIHDAGLYHDQFRNLINNVKNQDFSFFCLDLKGHGLSSGSRNQISDLNECSLDLASLLNKKSIIKNAPLFLVGSGVGATIILNLLFFYSNVLKIKLNGLILINPIFECEFSSYSGLKILSRLMKEKNNLKVKFPMNGYDLTGDLTCAEKYNSDPLVDFSFPLAFIENINMTGHRVVNFSYFIDLPTLLLSSIDDYKKFEMSVESDLLTHKRYPGNKRDILNDKERKKCFNDIIEWLGRF